MPTDKTKAKIQSLCPDVMARNVSVQVPAPFGGLINYRDDKITLAVVLRAIGTTKRGQLQPGITVDPLGYFRDALGGVTAGSWVCRWNLEKDSWDSQSPETQAFIGSLLGL